MKRLPIKYIFATTFLFVFVILECRGDESTNNEQIICDSAYGKGKAGDYNGVILECNKGIALYPSSSVLYFIRGMAEARLNLLNQAIIDYKLSLDLDHMNKDAYLYCAEAQEQSGDNAGAFTNLTFLIKIDPTNADYYYSRGNIQISLRDKAGAIKDFTKAIEANPNHAWAYNNRGMQQAGLENYELAISDLSKAISLDCSNAVFYQNRGQIKRISQDYNGAISDFKTSIKIDPQFVQAYAGLGFAYNSLGQFQIALTNLEKALVLKTNPLQTMGIEARAILLRMRMGQNQQVVNDITQGLKKSGYNGEVLKEIAFEIEPFLAGIISEDTFLRSATNSFWSPPLKQAQLCEACYYIGMKYMIAGDTNSAINFLKMGVETSKLSFDNVYFEEYHDTKLELMKLE